jgi:hypothetical protein
MDPEHWSKVRAGTNKISFGSVTPVPTVVKFTFIFSNSGENFYPISCGQGMEEKAAAVVTEEEEGEWLSIRQREELALQVSPTRD